MGSYRRTGTVRHFGIEFSEFEAMGRKNKKINLIPYDVCKKHHCKEL